MIQCSCLCSAIQFYGYLKSDYRVPQHEVMGHRLEFEVEEITDGLPLESTDNIEYEISFYDRCGREKFWWQLQWRLKMMWKILRYGQYCINGYCLDSKQYQAAIDEMEEVRKKAVEEHEEYIKNQQTVSQP